MVSPDFDWEGETYADLGLFLPVADIIVTGQKHSAMEPLSFEGWMASNGKRAEPSVDVINLEQIGKRPAGTAMDGVVNDLAIHLLPVQIPPGADFVERSRLGGEFHAETCE